MKGFFLRNLYLHLGMRLVRHFFLFMLFAGTISSCEKDLHDYSQLLIGQDTTTYTYNPTPYEVIRPSWFPPPILPANNPLSEQGVLLGRKLFYDPILSGDSTQSCASCHNQAYAFTDNGKRFSEGIDGLQGNRNAMTIVNFAYNPERKFFWDGRSYGLAAQALGPVPNPIEMHLSWAEAEQRLLRSRMYKKDFYAAFGIFDYTKEHVAKALEQFMLSIVSYQSRYDDVVKYGPFYNLTGLTPSEANGFQIFNSEQGDCFHCHHIDNKQLTDNLFHNNGLDTTFLDLGLGGFTLNPNQYGKFKTPSLRNIEFTYPYMHDGRFQTLDQVMLHYSFEVKPSSTVDPLMKKLAQGGVQLNPQKRADVIAFMKTFTDTAFLNNPAYSNPF